MGWLSWEAFRLLIAYFLTLNFVQMRDRLHHLPGHLHLCQSVHGDG
jgi:hypothetical protein